MPLEHSIEHRYALKTALEQLLGRQAWYDLKKTTSLTSWRKYVLKSIKAIRIATIESVQVRDRAWTVAIEDNLNRGEQAAAKCRGLYAVSCGTQRSHFVMAGANGWAGRCLSLDMRK